MIDNFISLFGSYTQSGLFESMLIPVLCLAFLATVPYIIRALFGR